MPIEIGPLAPVRPVRPKLAEAGERTPASAAPGVLIEAPALPATAPVDAERVAQIRSAISDGSYPLVPTRIADAMIAAGLLLSLGE